MEMVWIADFPATFAKHPEYQDRRLMLQFDVAVPYEHRGSVEMRMEEDSAIAQLLCLPELIGT